MKRTAIHELSELGTRLMPKPIELPEIPEDMTPEQVMSRMFSYSPPGFRKVQEKAIARRRENEEKRRLRKEKRLAKLGKLKPET